MPRLAPALCCLALLAAPSFASAAAPAGPRVVVDPARHDGLRAAFNAHFYPERLAPGDAVLADAHRHEDRGACLTGLVADLKANWAIFTDEEQAEMTAALAPWKGELTDPLGPPSVDGAPPPPDAPCFGYTYDNHLDSDHFSITWQDGVLTDTEAADFMESLEFSWTTEVDEQNWREPAGVGRDPMMIIVEEGGYAGAYTTIDQCPDGRYVPYIVAYEASFFDDTWYKVMACHEFNHACQYSYGMGHEFWWWEATATYMEEQVYPSVNDWANMVYSYSQRPDLGMNSWDVRNNDTNLFWHTYGMGIWGFYLDQHVGGMELIQDTWDYSRTHGSGYDLWMPDVINGVGQEFDDVYLGFITTNAVLDYDERNYFQTPADQNFDTLPAEGGPKNNRAPQSLGQNYLRFDKDLGGEGKVLEVTFDGDDTPFWYVALVAGTRTVDTVVTFELDDANMGTATIPFDGSSDIVLVVSPKDEEAQGYRYRWDNDEGFQYTFSARYYEEEVPDTATPGGDDGGVADDNTVSGAKDEGKSGLCATATPAASLGLLLGALGLAAGRRRR